MTQKALFLDLDGTLLNDKKEISSKNKEALFAMIREGHHVVLATVRALPSALLQAKKLGLYREGCFLIAYNGGLLYDTGKQKVIAKTSLPLPLVADIFREAEKRDIHIQTYDDEAVLVEARCATENVKKYCALTAMDYRVIPGIYSLQQEPVKLLSINFEHRAPLETFQTWLITHYGTQIEAFFSCKEYLEVVGTGVSKGSALLQMAELLRIPRENTYAAGDEVNDIPMLKAAYVGIAMQNATDETKAAADYITKHDNNHDGIAEVIEKLIL